MAKINMRKARAPVEGVSVARIVGLDVAESEAAPSQTPTAEELSASVTRHIDSMARSRDWRRLRDYFQGGVTTPATDAVDPSQPGAASEFRQVLPPPAEGAIQRVVRSAPFSAAVASICSATEPSIAEQMLDAAREQMRLRELGRLHVSELRTLHSGVTIGDILQQFRTAYDSNLNTEISREDRMQYRVHLEVPDATVAELLTTSPCDGFDSITRAWGHGLGAQRVCIIHFANPNRRAPADVAGVPSAGLVCAFRVRDPSRRFMFVQTDFRRPNVAIGEIMGWILHGARGRVSIHPGDPQ